VKEFRIYVEGGGDANSKARLRIAFGRFLAPLQDAARERRIGWRVIACGSRSDTFTNFRIDLPKHPDALMLLLVDAEGPLTGTPVEHISRTDGAARDLAGTSDAHIHLMVEAMEAWIVADAAALKRYYGQNFQASALPRAKNIETVPKQQLLISLDAATRNTQKGRYHKTHHAPELVEILSPATVRQRAPHCDRLFVTLEEALTG
jgi:hypothetical protein